MPELPEVETTVLDLKTKVLKRTFIDVWTDDSKIIKKPESFEKFKKELKRKKIKNIRRRGKNILIDLSDDKTLLIHQKMTGHLLLGKWKLEKGQWVSEIPGSLRDDPKNRFLHVIFFFDNGEQLALSDLRKFAKIELWDKNELETSKIFKGLGPEPLEKEFTFGRFKDILKKKGRIKQALLDQKNIAGIGNIYSSEILWEARVNPFKDVKELKERELGKIYRAIRKVLKKGIKLKGDSFSDFRRLDGTKGDFNEWARVYKREGGKCLRCKTAIKRKKLGGRSSYFCPRCQPMPRLKT